MNQFQLYLRCNFKQRAGKLALLHMKRRIIIEG